MSSSLNHQEQQNIALEADHYQLEDQAYHLQETESKLAEENTLSPQHEQPSIINAPPLPCILLKFQDAFYPMFAPYADGPEQQDVLFENMSCYSSELSDWIASMKEIFHIENDVIVEFSQLKLSLQESSSFAKSLSMDLCQQYFEALMMVSSKPVVSHQEDFSNKGNHHDNAKDAEMVGVNSNTTTKNENLKDNLLHVYVTETEFNNHRQMVYLDTLIENILYAEDEEHITETQQPLAEVQSNNNDGYVNIIFNTDLSNEEEGSFLRNEIEDIEHQEEFIEGHVGDVFVNEEEFGQNFDDEQHILNEEEHEQIMDDYRPVMADEEHDIPLPSYQQLEEEEEQYEVDQREESFEENNDIILDNYLGENEQKEPQQLEKTRTTEYHLATEYEEQVHDYQFDQGQINPSSTERLIEYEEEEEEAIIVEDTHVGSWEHEENDYADVEDNELILSRVSNTNSSGTDDSTVLMSPNEDDVANGVFHKEGKLSPGKRFPSLPIEDLISEDHSKRIKV